MTKAQAIVEINMFVQVMAGRTSRLSCAAKALPQDELVKLARIPRWAKQDGPDRLSEWYRNLTGRISDLTGTPGDKAKADQAYDL
jgi:hypothetical protein